jgi:hypothetical protein
MIEAAVYSKLSELGYQVYPIKLPQNASYPAITYMVIADNGEQNLTTADIYARNVRVQVDIWAKSYKDVKTIKAQVWAKLVELKASNLTAIDGFESDTELYREIIDFKILNKE